jgi:hypothetical protein
VILSVVASIEALVEAMRRSPTSVRFSDLDRVCRTYFGEPRQSGTSHREYRTPWAGDPRVNIQENHGMAKPYQVRQVLAAISKLEEEES